MAVANPTRYKKLEPSRPTIEAERLHRKQQLAGAFRVFGKFGFSEGVAGHITVRDPELVDHFWVNPFGISFNKSIVLLRSTDNVLRFLLLIPIIE